MKPWKTTTARIALGIIFTAAGLSGFLLIAHPPPTPPGLAGDFQTVFFASRWVLFVDGVELLAGILLLTGRYVPLALVLLGAIIVNITVFHVTMAPNGLPAAAVLTALWTLVAIRYRSSFAPLLAANTLPKPVAATQHFR